MIHSALEAHVLSLQMPQREVPPMGLPFDYHLPPNPKPFKPPQHNAFSIFAPTLARLSQRLGSGTFAGFKRTPASELGVSGGTAQ